MEGIGQLFGCRNPRRLRQVLWAIEGTLCFLYKGTQEGLQFPVSPARALSSTLDIQRGWWWSTYWKTTWPWVGRNTWEYGTEGIHSETKGQGLAYLVFEFRDIRRVWLSADGPAKVTPLKVHLKSDAAPRRAKARRHTPKYLDFTRKQIKLLEEMWHIRRNPHGLGSSPVLIVPNRKLPDECRMTVYPNSQLVAITGCLSILKLFFRRYTRWQTLRFSILSV